MVIAPNMYRYKQLTQLVWAESRLYTPMYIFQNCVLSRLSDHIDWTSCMYLPQFPRLPFCGLIYMHRYNSFIYDSLGTLLEALVVGGLSKSVEDPQ